MNRIIFLIDMNSYFASVEQVLNPALRGKAIVVCGEGRTVVTTASYEARKYGIKTAMTLYEAKRLFPGVICVRGDMNKYIDTSLRIHKILLDFTDQVEAFSIDECFLDVTHLCRNGREPSLIAVDIKKRIKTELGLLCSIGIGPNKVVAKLGSKMQKPDGLVQINEEEISGVFAKLPVEKLQGVGVGAKTSQKLRSLGINTAKELGDTPISMLSAHFGIVGYNLKRIGQGRDDAPVNKYIQHEQVKSVGHSYTFPRDTKNPQVIKSYLLMLSERVGARLREANLVGKTISLTVRYSDFTMYGRQHTLKHCIKSGQEIYSTAYKIIKQSLQSKKAVRMLGVTISGLAIDSGQQFLFDNIEKRQKLVETVDDINKKYGELTVKPSAILICEKFGIYQGCGMVPKSRNRLKN